MDSGSIEDNVTKNGKINFSALDLLPVPTFAANRDSKVVYANDAFAELVGEKRGRLDGVPIGSLIKSETSGVQRALTGDASGVDTWATIKGRRYFLECRPSPIYDHDGNITGVIETIINLTDQKLAMQAIQDMIAKVRAGQLSARVEVRTEGDYRLLAENINEMLGVLIAPLCVAVDHLDKIGKGIIPDKITDFYDGDPYTIKKNLNTCIETINAVTAEMDSLTKAIMDGGGDKPGNAERFQGAFKAMVQDMNWLVESVVSPLNELMAVLGRKIFN